MKWKIGEWQVYDEGEVHQTLKKCLNILIDKGYHIEAVLGRDKCEISKDKNLFKNLKDYEKKHGVNDLLEILDEGLDITCEKKGGPALSIKTNMRFPSDSDESKTAFKEMIIEWVDQNPLSFTERFFRLPKITEDPADRYLDNPLEKVLEKTFGFHFKYKISISCHTDIPDSQDVRRALYKALR